MVYVPTNWQDGVTPVNAANLNKLEQGLAAAVGIPADVVVLAANPLIRNRYNAADTQPAFRLMGDGSLYWGNGGASAPDTHLWRGAAHQLVTENLMLDDGALDVNTKSLVTQTAFGTWFLNEAQYRLEIEGTGKLKWSDGVAAPDTFLYRERAGTLRTDGSLTVGSGYLYSAAILGLDRGPAQTAVEIYATPDTDSKLEIKGDGKLLWGTGVAAKDTNLYRLNAGALKTDTQFHAGGNVQVGQTLEILSGSGLLSSAVGIYFTGLPNDGTGYISVARRASDTNWRWMLGSLGQISWGDGTLAPDVTLYRAGAGVLQTNSAMYGVSFMAQIATGGAGFVFNPATATGIALYSVIGGEANPRFYIDQSGFYRWGPGGAGALDTTLYRAGVGALKTDGQFTALNYIATSYGRFNSGLPNSEVVIGWDGAAQGAYIIFGPGGTWDTKLYRSAAGELTTVGTFVAGVNLKASGNVLLGDLGGGLNGGVLFGGDTSLYRASTNWLKTGGGIEVGANGLKFSNGSVQTKAGPVVAGYIRASDGAILNGSGFSVVKNGTGQYTITFTTAFSAPPAVTTARVANGMGFVMVTGAPTVSSFQVNVRGTGNGVEDTDFTFIAALTGG